MLVGERYYANLSSQEVWLRAGTGEYRADGLNRLDPALRAIPRARSPRCATTAGPLAVNSAKRCSATRA
jgi:hypothetical protein